MGRVPNWDEKCEALSPSTIIETFVNEDNLIDFKVSDNQDWHTESFGHPPCSECNRKHEDVKHRFNSGVLLCGNCFMDYLYDD